MKTLQSYYRQINYRRLLLLMFTFSVILLILFFVIFAYQESEEGNEIIYHIAHQLFYLIAFPVYLFPKVSGVNNLWVLIFSIITGILFYSLLIEMLIVKYQFTKKNKSEIEHPKFEKN